MGSSSSGDGPGWPAWESCWQIDNNIKFHSSCMVSSLYSGLNKFMIAVLLPDPRKIVKVKQWNLCVPRSWTKSSSHSIVSGIAKEDWHFWSSGPRRGRLEAFKGFVQCPLGPMEIKRKKKKDGSKVWIQEGSFYWAKSVSFVPKEHGSGLPMYQLDLNDCTGWSPIHLTFETQNKINRDCILGQSHSIGP